MAEIDYLIVKKVKMFLFKPKLSDFWGRNVLKS
ncbi:MAG: hypothetical protein SRB1_00586 [Desulfobacteraceae bacterium Eth-SRB1]|nr:MAG: hypothetical protein SRB1_00586 [Desulfobacteraceae bacterium Eth-SRB1]